MVFVPHVEPLELECGGWCSPAWWRWPARCLTAVGAIGMVVLSLEPAPPAWLMFLAFLAFVCGLFVLVDLRLADALVSEREGQCGPDEEQLGLDEDIERLIDIGELVLAGASIEEFGLTKWERLVVESYVQKVRDG